MEKEDILYEDPDFKIVYHEKLPEEHWLLLPRSGTSYLFSRGILKDLALTPRPDLERRLNTVNSIIVSDLKSFGLSVDSLGLAMAQAYIEKEKQHEKFMGHSISA